MFHPEYLPPKLLDTIMNREQQRPFTTSWEVLGLLIAYELIQEAGIHLPQAIGQSVSMIGGIVVGTAAVEAGLISPTVLIIVSVAGVCGFVLPNRDLANAVRIWRFAIAMLAAALGGWGVAAGFVLLLIHLGNLKCLDVPFLRIQTGQNRSVLRYRLKNQKGRNKDLRPEDNRNQQ